MTGLLCFLLILIAGACAGLLIGTMLAVIQESRRIEERRARMWNNGKRRSP